ncbi:MAG: hypothetical protein KY475_14225 [Planctomycetes bacterium]|nr:hypothetical protein [Planctomycetota bacterium]
MRYKYLTASGALHEGAPAERASRGDARSGAATASHTLHADAAQPIPLNGLDVPLEIVELVPESVARECRVFPLALHGETMTLAAVDPDDLALTDRLRFLLAKDVRLVKARRGAIERAIDRHYGQIQGESADSLLQEFTDTAVDFCEDDLAHAAPARGGAARGESIREYQTGLAAPEGVVWRQAAPARRMPGAERSQLQGRRGMFFFTVEEGQKVLMHCRNGTIEVLSGPCRRWIGSRRFQPMEHYVAHPGEFLILRFRDGRQQHLIGPAELWFDPRVHLSVEKEDGLQVSAKEAVVVYSQAKNSGAISRRIVYGPTLFTPEPGEWLHRFSWHASRGGSQGVSKKPNALVFHKLWLMPDQMYHDVPDVRTADDAVLTIRLMIFFELLDIERMLDSTHDPIGDFVNAATSDVVEFIGRRDFEGFKRETEKLNELETYKQLARRGQQCGYRITNVVYRGYGAPPSLQQMHDQAIEARTRLQLDRATEQQAQELENYKLECQLQRAGKRRTEQTSEVEHDLQLAAKRGEAQMREAEAKRRFSRQERQRDADLQAEIRRNEDARQREHLTALKEMGVDLTAYLTQGRADRVIELRGGVDPHIHLDRLTEAPADRRDGSQRASDQLP